MHRLSLVAASGGYSLLRCVGFSLWWLLLLRSTGSRRPGFSSCGARASVVAARGLSLWHTGLVAPWHVGPSRTTDWTRVPCIGRRIFNHCATREVPHISFFFFLFIYLFIYLFFGVCWVFVSVRGLSLVAASGGHSSLQCAGLTISASFVAEHRLQTRRLSNCGSGA